MAETNQTAWGSSPGGKAGVADAHATLATMSDTSREMCPEALASSDVERGARAVRPGS
jgi:hypothetical protein